MSYEEKRIGSEEAVAAAIEAAEEIQDPVSDEVPQKPRLLVENSNPDITVARLRDVLTKGGELMIAAGPCALCSIKARRALLPR